MQLDEKSLSPTILAIPLLAFSLLNIFIQYSQEWIQEFACTEIGLLILTFILPFVIHDLLQAQKNIAKLTSQSIYFCHGLLIQLIPSSKDWIKFILFSIIIAVFGLITVQPGVFGLPWEVPLINTLFRIWVVTFLLGYGIVICLYLFNLNSICKLDKVFGVNVNESDIFAWPINEVRSIYITCIRLLKIAVFIYISAIVSLLRAPGVPILALETDIGLLWIVSPAILILTYFLIFNRKIRSFLPRWKLSALNYINIFLKQESCQYFHKHSNHKPENINSLLTWRRNIQTEDIEVYDWKPILAIVGILLGPTITILSPPIPPTIKEVISEIFNLTILN